MTNDVNTNRGTGTENTASRFSGNNVNKSGSKKGLITTIIICVVVLLIGVLVVNSIFKNQEQKNQAVLDNQKKSYTQIITSRDSVINEWMLTFDEIEKDLRGVKEKENIITMNSSDKEFTKDKKEQIIKDIEYINTVLDQNKKKIASLTAQLKNSGATIKGMQARINELEETIKQRETEIAELKENLSKKDIEIGQLNNKMSEQQVAIEQKDAKISTQTAEINKAFVVLGTYKDLRNKNIISKEGGFLGLGKKESLHHDFSDNEFTQIDITQTKSITVNSKDAKLITSHPSSSYEIVRDKDNKKVLSIEIKDPEQFWKISKYAVVEIKN